MWSTNKGVQHAGKGSCLVHFGARLIAKLGHGGSGANGVHPPLDAELTPWTRSRYARREASPLGVEHVPWTQS